LSSYRIGAIGALQLADSAVNKKLGRACGSERRHMADTNPCLLKKGLSAFSGTAALLLFRIAQTSLFRHAPLIATVKISGKRRRTTQSSSKPDMWGILRSEIIRSGTIFLSLQKGSEDILRCGDIVSRWLVSGGGIKHQRIAG
jgi:hypothetical protein